MNLDQEEKRFVIGAVIGLCAAVGFLVISEIPSPWGLLLLIGLPISFGAIAMFWEDIFWLLWY